MNKRLLSSLLLASSFLLFNNHSSAAELNTSTNQPLEYTDDIIYFDIEKDDILVTDDIIIKTVKSYSDVDKYKNDINSLIQVQGIEPPNGEWDLVGFDTVYSKSSIQWSSGGDFKVVVDQTDFGPVFYQLKEHDGTIFDQNVGKQMIISGSGTVEIVYRNISSYVDDDLGPGIAEFYMQKLTHTSKGYFMAFYN